ncbi:beta-galactosidase [Streptacidiphilus sp. MAP12-16]|uniref:beta-galactosidase n=1 Tax=Streptacidiphilus sp. MAP12-16 TaxID=3156300 RepID=UPI0035132A95
MPPITTRLSGSGLAFGGDYNPEQWPEEVWADDMALMREAGVTMVSVGVFSWALLEPAPGVYDFGWLDRLLALLHEHGIAVDLGTPTTVPPAWFYQRHPEALPVTKDGQRLAFGGRGAICHSSPAYREAATAVTTRLAERYADHPALAMWHVHNEYGAPVSECYCDISAEDFRRWLRERHQTLDALNEAWGTTFWGQRYSDWAQIQPPRRTPTAGNPGQQLDFKRFTSDAMLANFTAERDILHRLSVGVPVTTNFMTALSQCRSVDYWAWGREVDVVSNDHYLVAEAERTHVNLAMSADITRSVAGGAPWLLLEHSTGAVNWQPRNIAKRPGEMARNSLSHVARGSDGAMFFQWRASRFGAEKFHSTMLPHAGTDSRIWREVVRLGADLGRLAEIQGSRVRPDVAVLWDWHSWWAEDMEWRPTEDHSADERADAWYEALYDRHLTVDFAHPEAELAAYPLVVVPSLYLMTEAASANLRRYVEQGGVLVVSYFSGIVDATDTVHPGAHPGALRDVLGLTVEEFLPLRAGRQVALSGDAAMTGGGLLSGDVWTETVVPRGADTVWRYADGPAAGGPAVTRHALGAGHAWYVSTRLAPADLDRVLALASQDTRLDDREDLPRDVEIVHREGEQGSYLFAINHTAAETKVPLPVPGTELLTGERTVGRLCVPVGGVRVVRLDREPGDEPRG